MRNAKTIAISALLSLSILAPTGAAAELPKNAEGVAKGSETYRQLGRFASVFDEVRRNHVDDTEDAKLVENALKGMLSGLDPHSAYLPPEDAAMLTSETKGSFGGLGIEIAPDEGAVRVVAPIDDSPAAKAGIRTGDRILRVAGIPVREIGHDEAVRKMRGKPGSEVTVTVERDGKTFDKTIVRAVIVVPAAKGRIEKDVAVVRLSRFSENAAERLREEIELLDKEKPLGWILDLRSNPGGLLDQAVAVAGLFVAKGEIVSVRGRGGVVQSSRSVKGTDVLRGAPLVVLIDGGSASASEIVAGALRDHKRATLVGTTTFGKGSVQSVIGLNDGSAVKLTTGRYYTPAGVSIQGDGLKPDVEIHKKGREIKGGTEGRLTGALGKSNGERIRRETPETEATKTRDEKEVGEEKGDPQLDKAVEIVRERKKKK
jgi:carboxyl-terminal processing protease